MSRPDFVNRLLSKYPHLERYVSYLENENKELKSQIKGLTIENQELREQIEQNTKAIRSILFKANNQTDKPKKLGPPRNHKPNNRPVPRQIHRKLKLSLKLCPDCGSKLSRPVRVRKRYVEDVRPPEPMNTEYQIPYYYCKHCKRQVTAKPADVIPKCRFGIKLMLLMTFLRYGLSMPLNKIARELSIIYAMDISEGCIVDAIGRFAQFSGPEFEQIKQKVRELAVVHTDWTGWRINGKNTTLWDFVNKEYSLLLIRNDRSRGVIEEVLGEDYDGIIVSDCMPATAKLGCRQQKCWVHFLRYTRELDSPQGKLLHARLKHIHKLAQSGRLSVDSLLRRIDALRDMGFTERKCIRMVNRLDKYRGSLFTFVEIPEVPDNNNEAERPLRPSVVMRKITGGNRSDRGARNHEIIMSVMDTWDKQGRDFFEEGMKMVQEGLR